MCDCTNDDYSLYCVHRSSLQNCPKKLAFNHYLHATCKQTCCVMELLIFAAMDGTKHPPSARHWLMANESPSVHFLLHY